MKVREAFLLAKHPCRAKVKGHRLPCLDTFVVINVDGKYRMGTLKCLKGHPRRGKQAEVLNPDLMPPKKRGKRGKH